MQRSEGPQRRSGRAPHSSDVQLSVETLAVEIEVKRAAKSVIDRIVNLRDSL